MEFHLASDRFKGFVHATGWLACIASAGLGLYFALALLWGFQFRELNFDLIIVCPPFFGFWYLLALAGWRTARNWNRETIKIYGLLQAAVTGYAIGKVAGLFLPVYSTVIGNLTFYFLGRFLEKFLLKYFGFSDTPKASNRASKLPTNRDVAGTPWQDNPGHTA